MDSDVDFRFSPRPNRAHEIDWRPWGEPAFAEARKLGRPILLSLSAVWCHWCHVMDETSYSDPRVIAAVNEHFVPIRVDNDRHPDVNRRYNMGGWPTTAFLAASGDPITGATYMPPEQMLQALERVSEFFAANRTALLTLGATDHAQDADGEAALAHLGGVPRKGALSAPDFDGDPDVPGDIPAEIALQIVRAFDPVHGGLGSDPKFPQADVFAFGLAFAELRGGGEPLHATPHTSALVAPGRMHEVVRTTLQRMATGGLYDHVAGGFFRYATRRDWSVPHYEKMLEDNARLAGLYLEAAVLAHGGGVSGSGAGDGGAAHARLGVVTLYTDTAAGTIDYLLATLWRGGPPAFGGSQDADEHYYCLDDAGRAELPEPFVDPTVYVDWNALAARALLRAAPVLQRPELTERAVELLGFLWERSHRGAAMAHYLTTAGEPGSGAPLLVDQATMAAALLDAYEVTTERRWLEGAQALAGWAGRHLRAPDSRLHDRLAEPGASAGLLARPLPVLDENALMAEVLLRLEAYTGVAAWRDQAREILMAWATHYEESGVTAAAYGQALLRYLERPDHIVVVGSRGDDMARRLLGAALAAPWPLRTVQFLDPDDAADAERMAAAGFTRAAAAAAYVCRGATCQAPVTDPEELGRPL
ncbi:MAG: DUF255 domain-containing protein [Actinobacteria bacterium]|nr:DUF255 domain-containing protein [Actinomycetota bacterium]